MGHIMTDENVIPFKPKVTEIELAMEQVFGEKCIPFEIRGNSMSSRGFDQATGS